MDQIKIGKFIQTLRKELGLTQKELAEKLNVTHQAVSKWELGETLPDAAILLDLCDILGISVDMLLRGGSYLIGNRKRLVIKDVLKGFECIKDVKKYFGQNSSFYVGMISGINNLMNIDFEDGLNNHLEVLVAEVLLQGMISGDYYVDLDEAKGYFRSEKLYNLVAFEMNKITN